MESTDVFMRISFCIINQITDKMCNSVGQRGKPRKMYLPPDSGNHCLTMTWYFIQPIFFNCIQKNIMRLSQRA